jgi:hypothetical protein
MSLAKVRRVSLSLRANGLSAWCGSQRSPVRGRASQGLPAANNDDDEDNARRQFSAFACQSGWFAQRLAGDL